MKAYNKIIQDLESKNIELLTKNSKLRIELEDYKVRLEALRAEKDKLKELIRDLNSELFDAKRVNGANEITSLKTENWELKDKVKALEKSIEGNEENFNLSMKNRELEAKLELSEKEIEHLKKLVDMYREMPDVKNMVDNLSKLAVPSIDELKKFARVFEDSEQVGKMVDALNESSHRIDRALARLDNRPYYRGV